MTTYGSGTPGIALSALVTCALLVGCSASPDDDHDDGPVMPGEPQPDWYVNAAFLDGTFVVVGGRPNGNPDPFGRDALAGLVLVGDGDSFVAQVFDVEAVLQGAAFGDARLRVAGYSLGSSGDFASTNLVAERDASGTWRVLDAPAGLEEVHDVAFFADRFVLVGKTPDWANAVFAEGPDGWELIRDFGEDAGVEPQQPNRELWSSARLVAGPDRLVIYGDGRALAETVDLVEWILFDTELSVVSLIEYDEQVGFVGTGWYDCCFGRVPGGMQSYELHRVPDADAWTREGYDPTTQRIAGLGCGYADAEATLPDDELDVRTIASPDGGCLALGGEALYFTPNAAGPFVEVEP